MFYHSSQNLITPLLAASSYLCATNGSTHETSYPLKPHLLIGDVSPLRIAHPIRTNLAVTLHWLIYNRRSLHQRQTQALLARLEAGELIVQLITVSDFGYREGPCFLRPQRALFYAGNLLINSDGGPRSNGGIII